MTDCDYDYLLMTGSVIRWSRGCDDELKDQLPQFADSSLRSGWLELMSAGSGFSYDLRVPGSFFHYQCSAGFELPDKSNPEQPLVCQGSRSVDTSAVISCVRKLTI